MSLSVLNPSLCLYIAISPGRMCLFQGHVACWNLTQRGLIVKTHSRCQKIYIFKKCYFWDLVN